MKETLYDARRRRGSFAAVAPLCALLATAAAQGAGAATVALDVGHFLAAPGAISARGRAEFEFNRDLARVLADALAERGLRVKLIGADGAMARLTARTRAAAGADFLLSVHHDSVQPHYLDGWVYGDALRAYSDRYAGFSLFVSRANPGVKQSLACASAMGAALRRAGFTPSLYHAEPVAGEFKPFADRTNGVHYYDNLVVLKTATSPAVLLESGVIVNRDEELRLSEPAVRAAIAAAVAEGLRLCLRAGH
jgi:N-acetylmuramoyl-L-alanine amidase